MNNLLKECDLLKLLQQLNSLTPPLSMHSIASAAAIEKGTQLLISKMYTFVNNVFFLKHPKQRKRMSLDVCLFISTYNQRLYNAVHDPENGYLDVDTIIVHTPQQIKTLLDCD